MVVIVVVVGRFIVVVVGGILRTCRLFMASHVSDKRFSDSWVDIAHHDFLLVVLLFVCWLKKVFLGRFVSFRVYMYRYSKLICVACWWGVTHTLG